MKKKIITGLAFLALSANILFAGTPTAEALHSINEVRSEIIGNVAPPSFVTAHPSSAEVKAIVQVDENGKLQIHEISSDNPLLKNYVLVSLRNMKVNKAATEKFIVLIRFKNS